MLSQQASSEYEFFWFVVILNVASFMLIVIILSLSYSRRTEGKGMSETYTPLIGAIVPHWAEISIGFTLAFIVASLINLFASMPAVILGFVITWIVSSYLVYRYPELRV